MTRLPLNAAAIVAVPHPPFPAAPARPRTFRVVTNSCVDPVLARPGPARPGPARPGRSVGLAWTGSCRPRLGSIRGGPHPRRILTSDVELLIPARNGASASSGGRRGPASPEMRSVGGGDGPVRSWTSVAFLAVIPFGSSTVHPSVRPSVCLSYRPSVRRSVLSSVRPSRPKFVRQSVLRPSVCPFFRPSDLPSVVHQSDLFPSVRPSRS